MRQEALAWHGSIPALATPFRVGDLEVDEDALARLVERAIARGSTAVLACGSTGEGPALSAEEHARTVRAVAEATAGRVPVIAGIGAPSTQAAVSLAHAAALNGAAALLVSPPPYVKPSQEGIRAHVRAVAVATALPIILYDVPSRAGVAIADETIARLVETSTIAGLKDASGDLSRPPKLMRLCGAAFPQLSGDDATALAHLAMGGVGCISVTANVTPGLCAALQRAWTEGDQHRAAELRDRLAPLDAALFCESNPVPLKAALGLLGFCDPVPRLPLMQAAETTTARLARVLVDLAPFDDTLSRPGAASSRPREVA